MNARGRAFFQGKYECTMIRNCCSLNLLETLSSELTPADNTKSIDHGCVRVSTNHTVRVQRLIRVEYNPGKVLQVDLVDNS